MSKIEKVFVLMLENRSFDHILGFSGLTGEDINGNAVGIEGLTGNEQNKFKIPFFDPEIVTKVKRGAKYIMPYDPLHEFPDIYRQLTSKEHKSGQPYSPINMNGFTASYFNTLTKSGVSLTSIINDKRLQDIMACFSKDQLPVLTTLAEEFAVCDHWFSSLPGPTWPNRYFGMAGSSGNLDSSPNKAQMAYWIGPSWYQFQHGNIFSMVGNSYRIYSDNRPSLQHVSIPISTALFESKEEFIFHLHGVSKLKDDLQSADYEPKLTYIEANYGDMFDNFKGGSSQHPNSDVRKGEELIKVVYEAIRNSPHWDKSLLIITYDEHGGFYDHVKPPQTTPPGDRQIQNFVNDYGFDFKQLGVRVPAVVVSPYIKKNTVDKRVFDHSSIPATLSAIFGLPQLTNRSTQANTLVDTLRLSTPRSNNETPTTLPSPKWGSGEQIPGAGYDVHDMLTDAIPPSGNLIGFLMLGYKTKIALSPDSEKTQIKNDFHGITTVGDAKNFMSGAHQLLGNHLQRND